MALMTDFRAAIRALLAARGFTALAVLTLGVGFALTATILAVVHAYVWRSLPYPAADRLYRVDYAPPGEPWPEGMEQLDWASLADVIEIPLSWDLDVFYLLGRDYPESAPGAWVTPGYMQALGIRVSEGRTFTADDFRPGHPSVAIISHRLWQTRFGGDADVVGKTFRAYVSDRPQEPEAFTIVGVLPADFWHLNSYTEVLAPLRAPSYPYQLRLRGGVTPAAAAARIDALVRSGATRVPQRFGTVLVSVQDSYVAQLKPVLWSILAGTALVLLIAATNVAVLMIVRARKRERELAVRLALGASHTRVARLVALEGVVLGVSAVLVGLALANAALPAIAPIIERSLGRRVPGGLDALSLDSAVIVAVLVCGVIVTSLLMLISIALLWRSRGTLTVGGSSRGLTDSAHAGRSRAVLIAVEVAASVTLLAGAGLMADSALRMLRVEFGVDVDHVVTAGLALRQQSFPEEQDRADFYTRLETELRSVSKSATVAFGERWPLQEFRPRRVEATGSDTSASATSFAVSPQYFDALGIDVLDGRVFSPQDRLGAAPVMIVSASLASRLWPHGRAVGRHVTMHPDGEGQPWTATVIGVVSDVRQSHTDVELTDAYVPLAQRPSRFAFIYVRDPRGTTWESDLRVGIARVHPEVALGTPRPLAETLEQERARPRFLAALLVTFAIFASALALLGMHGVIAYAVRQRRREIAIRIAVGASPRAVSTMFLRAGGLVLTAGLIIGIAGALALGRILESQLYGVQPAEPRVLVAAIAVFSAFALAAVLGPAWRAAAIDPVHVLKDD